MLVHNIHNDYFRCDLFWVKMADPCYCSPERCPHLGDAVSPFFEVFLIFLVEV